MIVTNNGPDNVIGLTLSLSLPGTFLNPVFTPSTGTYTSTNGNWTNLNLSAGQSALLTISGTISPAASGSLAVSATVSPSPGVNDTNTNNNTSTDIDTLTSQADLSIAITDGKTSVQPGSKVTYTITVTNNGPSIIQSLKLTDTLPPLLQNPVFSPAQGIYNETNGVWTGLSLYPAQSVILTLTGTVDPTLKTNLVNIVQVATQDNVTDPVPENNTATDTDFMGPNIVLIKSTNQVNPLPGAEIIYTVYYQNVGGVNALNVNIVDTVPQNTTYISGSLRTGNSASTYDTASVLTDAADNDAGKISGSDIIFIIPTISADDGIANSGNDEGKLYFKVKIN